MTSLLNSYKQTSAMYSNIASVYGKIYDTKGEVIPWSQPEAGELSTALTTPGACVFRDMGKTIYLPAAKGPQTILRKIQLVPAGSRGIGDPSNDFYKGYIRLGNGADDAASPIVRIS
jgi:hypothetical protein